MKNLNVMESKKLAEKFGIKFAQSALAKGVDDALIAANNIKYPVALKVVSDDVSHKSDVGGVAVGIRDDHELQSEFRKIISSVKKKSKGSVIKGILVQKMVEDGVEVLVGGKKDPQFGQVLVFGLGGTFVEIMKDVSFRLAPVNKKEALEMMAETKGFKILDGYRGKSYDTDAVASVIVKVSKMLDKNRNISEMDLNPVIATKKGALAADARIVLE